MDFLKDELVDVLFKDQMYKDLIYLESNDTYLVCAETNGVIKLFNHRWVKHITYRGNRLVEEQGDNVVEEETVSVPAEDTLIGGFIPEGQTKMFRLDEMKKCASTEQEFKISNNLGVVEPRG